MIHRLTGGRWGVALYPGVCTDRGARSADGGFADSGVDRHAGALFLDARRHRPDPQRQASLSQSSRVHHPLRRRLRGLDRAGARLAADPGQPRDVTGGTWTRVLLCVDQPRAGRLDPLARASVRVREFWCERCGHPPHGGAGLGGGAGSARGRSCRRAISVGCCSRWFSRSLTRFHGLAGDLVRRSAREGFLVHAAHSLSLVRCSRISPSSAVRRCRSCCCCSRVFGRIASPCGSLARSCCSDLPPTTSIWWCRRSARWRFLPRLWRLSPWVVCCWALASDNSRDDTATAGLVCPLRHSRPRVSFAGRGQSGRLCATAAGLMAMMLAGGLLMVGIYAWQMPDRRLPAPQRLPSPQVRTDERLLRQQLRGRPDRASLRVSLGKSAEDTDRGSHRARDAASGARGAAAYDPIIHSPTRPRNRLAPRPQPPCKTRLRASRRMGKAGTAAMRSVRR